MLKLEVEKREATQKPKKLREEGKIPAVFYSGKEPTTSITLSKKDFEKVWKEAGESSVIELSGVGDNKEALIHDVDTDPVSGSVRHADFYIIEKGKKVTVKVPIEFDGTPLAVKDLGGTLVKVIHELEIEVLPKDLPHNIIVDVSSLSDFESRIFVKDIKLPEGVISLLSSDDAVALVTEVIEEIEEEAEAPDLSGIESEQKGKGGEEETVTDAESENTNDKTSDKKA